MRLLNDSVFEVNWQQLGDAVAGPPNTVAEPTGHRDIAVALRSIVARLSESLSITEMVAGLPVGRRTLERRFQTQLGISIRQAVLRIRLEVARQMLVRSQLTITEISVEAGFASPSRMSHVFRRQLAYSPRHYRQQYRARDMDI